MGKMDGKVVLITGAARGQGRSHALKLAGEGADVVAFDCPGEIDGVPFSQGTPDDLAETVRGVEALDRRVLAVEGDVRSQADLDRAVEEAISKLGRLDICVANAGVAQLGQFWEIDETEWEATIQTNLNGVWKTCKAVTPHFIEQGAGVFVLISSLNGVEGAPMLAPYVAAKHGVLGLMKSICLELSPKYAIRANAILPGPVDTDIIKWQGMLDFMAGGEGLGRLDNLNDGCKIWGSMKDVGVIPTDATSNAVLYLASDDSKYVNGLEMVVDAGHKILPGLNSEEMAAQAAAAS